MTVFPSLCVLSNDWNVFNQPLHVPPLSFLHLKHVWPRKKDVCETEGKPSGRKKYVKIAKNAPPISLNISHYETEPIVESPISRQNSEQKIKD